jgi:hypothetical protein
MLELAFLLICLNIIVSLAKKIKKQQREKEFENLFKK